MTRSFLLLAALAAFMVTASTAPAGTTGKRALRSLEPARLAAPARAFRDTALGPRASRRLQDLRDTSNFYYTSDGTRIHMYVSNAYSANPTAAQSFVDLLGFLLHGRELAALTVYIGTADEVQGECGPDAIACYSPSERALVAPGEDVDGTPVEQVVAHEYGHHVAASRSNLPWRAAQWGTKRWASYVNVCRNERQNKMFPGAEPPYAPVEAYMLNPGEGFAEAYRRLNEIRAATWTPIGWQVVSPVFEPNQKALNLVLQDVLTPWSAPKLHTSTGVVRAAARKTVRIRTPLDGTLRVTVQSGNGTVARVVAPSGAQLAGPGARVSATICGQRTLKIALTAPRRGTYTLRLLTP